MRLEYLRKAPAALKAFWRGYIVPAFHRDWKFLLTLFGVALVIRISFAIMGKPIDTNETLLFNKLAVTKSIGVDDAPLYAHFLRVLYALRGHPDFKFVTIVQGILSASLVFLIYHITGKLWNYRAGLLAAGLCVFYPPFWIYHMMISTSTLALFLVMFMMAVIVSDLPERTAAVLNAAACALGILLLPRFIFFIPGLLIAVKKRRLFAAVLVGMLLPWTVRNCIVARAFVPLYSMQTFGLNALAFTWRPSWHRTGYTYRGFGMILKKAMSKGLDARSTSLKFTNPHLVAYAYLIAASLGIVGMIRRYTPRHRNVVLLVWGYVVLYVLCAIQNITYRILIEPLFLIYIAILLYGEKNVTDPAPAPHPEG